MNYSSTRGDCPPVGLSRAILDGLAPDGGLYVPAALPRHDPAAFADCDTLPELAARMLAPFFAGDPLAEQLPEITAEALAFEIPLRELPDGCTAVLELFHGPTAAFKDVGARFLSACLTRIPEARGQTVLVATSGDTGAAIAAAFHRQPGIEVVVLFPEGGVSARQQHQLTCWGDNISSLAVRGTFDDCQRMVKQAFGDRALNAHRALTSANSISIGRMLPQAVYHAAAGLWYERAHGEIPAICLPTGNLGNAAAALWAKAMGFPIRHVAMASNANDVIPNYLRSGSYRPAPSRKTLANAMDVGDPSNMERLCHLYPDIVALRRDASALSVDDATIRRTIAAGPARWQSVWCPHTATAVYMREQQPSADWVIVATAHPAKFETIVEPLVGQSVPVPEALLEMMARESRFREISPTLDALCESLNWIR